jgi:hypothetical protein
MRSLCLKVSALGVCLPNDESTDITHRGFATLGVAPIGNTIWRPRLPKRRDGIRGILDQGDRFCRVRLTERMG